MRFDVLDKGFVELIDVMGSDQAVCEAARVTVGKDNLSVPLQDRHLIRYMFRHGHTTPFEMCEVKFLVECPMDTWRQWIRHRTANVNEYSTRYTVALDYRQCTGVNQWRMQSDTNRQGSCGYLPQDVGETLTIREKHLHDLSDEVYNERLCLGVAKEQARKDLPLSTYTRAVWKIDLHNLLHFLSLRMDTHAQHEIREYANAIGKIVQTKFPLTWEAFEEYDHRRGGMLLSATDITAVQVAACTPPHERLAAVMVHCGWSPEGRHRERDECITKLQRLGLL